jgi:hypothetical protein
MEAGGSYCNDCNLQDQASSQGSKTRLSKKEHIIDRNPGKWVLRLSRKKPKSNKEVGFLNQHECRKHLGVVAGIEPKTSPHTLLNRLPDSRSDTNLA